MSKNRRGRKPTDRPKTIFSAFDNLDLSEFTEPYKELKQDYEELMKKRMSLGTPYRITFKGYPDLIYLTFAKNKDKAKYNAVKYYKENCHPAFFRSGAEEMYRNSRANIMREFEEYSIEGKIPIPKLMEIVHLTFPCSVCRKHDFNFEDYLNNKCYIIEGEGDLNDFAKGYILCKECYKKYINKDSRN